MKESRELMPGLRFLAEQMFHTVCERERAHTDDVIISFSPDTRLWVSPSGAAPVAGYVRSAALAVVGLRGTERSSLRGLGGVTADSDLISEGRKLV